MRKWLPLAAICLGAFMLLVDVSIVNVALPGMAADLHSSFSDLQWVVDAYVLTLAALLMALGSLGDRLGHRRLYLGGLAVFAFASVACALADDAGTLISARAVQGVGAAGMMTATTALLTAAYQGRDRGVAFGVWGAVSGAAAAVGPVLGGLLTDGFGWPAIFLVNVPVALVAVLLTAGSIPIGSTATGTSGTGGAGRGRPDVAGAVTFTVFAGALTYGLIESGDHGWGSKRQVVREVQAAEVNRLMRLVARVLPWHDQDSLRRALEALLVAMDRYRAYLGVDEPAGGDQAAVLNAAESRAITAVAGPDQLSVSTIAQLARGGRLPEAQAGTEDAQREFLVRFQQTCGPVMAKGIEDTAFYRYARLTSLNEVGGDPERVGISPDELHEFAARQLATWPTTMTTLSTHDTKRSEDVRARLAVVSELSAAWRTWLTTGRRLAAPHRGARLDPATEYLLWQTAVGAWPVSAERLQAYATKAIREAKRHTTWTDQDEAYEQDVQAFVTALVTQPALVAHCQSWVDRTAAATRVNILGQKLLQLVLPGVPDVYQGTELVDLSLVDPDNRRPVDYGVRRERLARLDRGETPRDLDDEKLLVTSRSLRLRHHHAQWFTGEHATYTPVPTTSDHALAVGRGDETGTQVIAVVTRLSEGLADGWGDAHVAVPEGEWHDLFTGRAVVSVEGRPGVRLARVLADLPVALLVRHGTLGRDEIA